MPGRLLIMDAEFFADFKANTEGMQFSGDNHEALIRLRALAEGAFPQNWADLMRWPVQCTCRHSMEFAVLFYVARMKCPMCQTDVGASDLLQSLTEKATDRERYHMIVASLNDAFVFGLDGEATVKAFRATVMMTDDSDIAAEMAEELNLGARYKRRE